VTRARQALGRTGEAAARSYLARRGVRVVAENYACAAGEIDLVGREGETLVFIEVKTRTSRAFGAPQLAVHWRKQRQIVKAAQWFLAEHRLGDVACRFDVLAVRLVGEDAPPQIEWVRDAFPAEGVRVF
jgi:putative endonuclease